VIAPYLIVAGNHDVGHTAATRGGGVVVSVAPLQ
jgi:hypothetical protein